MTARRTRVAQWATGMIGSESLRLTIDHPDLELVGVYVYTTDKAGRDAGELCGYPATGVVSTGSAEAIVAVAPDVVLHTPRRTASSEVADREVETLLRAGINVVTIRGYFWPAVYGTAYEKRFADAARDGGASLCAVGINPGFLNDRIGPALTSMCSTVRAIEFGIGHDMHDRSDHAIFDVCGIGLELNQLTADSPAVKELTPLYTEMFHCIAAQLGTRVTAVTTEIEPSAASRDLEIRGRTIRQGTVGGAKWRWRAELEAGPELRYEARWYIDDQMPGWDTRHVRSIRIDGDPPLLAEFVISETPARPGDIYDPTTRAMAALVVNAIPDVRAAAPGIVTPHALAPWRVPSALLTAGEVNA